MRKGAPFAEGAPVTAKNLKNNLASAPPAPCGYRHLADTACGGGEQADALIWVRSPNTPAAVAEKFLREFKRGLFSKSPLFSHLLYGIFFLLLFLLCHLAQKKKKDCGI